MLYALKPWLALTRAGEQRNLARSSIENIAAALGITVDQLDL
jgi:hypothetical protein